MRIKTMLSHKESIQTHEEAIEKPLMEKPLLVVRRFHYGVLIEVDAVGELFNNFRKVSGRVVSGEFIDHSTIHHSPQRGDLSEKLTVLNKN